MPRNLYLVSNLTIAAAWALFVVSFFLPAVETLTGWQAFTGSLLGLAVPWVWLVEPRVFLFFAFPIANAVMLTAPIIRYLLRDSAAVLAVFLIPMATLPWLLSSTLLGHLRIGFYCWNASFVIMSMGCILVSISYAKLDEEYYESLFKAHPPAGRDLASRDPFSP